MIIIIFLIVTASGARIGDGAIQEALSLGHNINTTRDECIWRAETDSCTKGLIRYILYTRDSESEDSKEYGIKSAEIDLSSPAWLHSSDWNPSLETVILIHGYGGTNDQMPIGILKDAYITNGSYNVIVVDWGPLAKLPCYFSAVHNIKSAAKCTADLYTFLRNSGVDMQRTTCIGHSLGAHVCGVVANYLKFRMHRIIGLDPAKPLIPNLLKSRLDAGDADTVQVLHTNSNYGDPKKIGHVDFYFNGGRIQPFCSNASNADICSHVRSVCYLAESIFSETIRHGTKCKRRDIMGHENPKGILNRVGNAHFMPIGQNTPDGAIGTYCVSNIEPPYCSENGFQKGNPLCCKPSANANYNVLSIPMETTTEKQI